MSILPFLLPVLLSFLHPNPSNSPFSSLPPPTKKPKAPDATPFPPSPLSPQVSITTINTIAITTVDAADITTIDTHNQSYTPCPNRYRRLASPPTYSTDNHSPTGRSVSPPLTSPTSPPLTPTINHAHLVGTNTAASPPTYSTDNHPPKTGPTPPNLRETKFKGEGKSGRRVKASMGVGTTTNPTPHHC